MPLLKFETRSKARGSFAVLASAAAAFSLASKVVESALDMLREVLRSIEERAEAATLEGVSRVVFHTASLLCGPRPR